MNKIEDLQALVLARTTDWKQHGEVSATYNGDLVLFNYTQAAQFAGRWNWFELNARGLILNAKTGEIVARPFRKFFNYGEHMPMQNAQIVEVTEKMDGSLGILYWKDGDGWRIATRGSFTSEQALWATDFFRRHWNWSPAYNDWTFLFEIIYPSNRIVVDYQGLEELVLIGARHKQHGHEMYYQELKAVADKYGMMQPKTFAFNDVREILEAAEALSANEEGWVLRYSDNERYKVKGNAYRLAHKILTGVTFKRVLDVVEIGAFDQMIEGVPDEFLAQIRAWKTEIDTEIQRIQERVAVVLTWSPQGTQKEFALWVQERFDKEFQAYLYAAKAGKDILPIIYKKAFENRRGITEPTVRDIDA